MSILSRESLRSHRVPAGSLTLWWLGQAGFVVKSPAGILVAVDPYLSNSCKAIGDQAGFNMDRMVPVPLPPADLADIDLYAITHSHGDHLDPETLAAYRAAGGTGPFLAPAETVEKLLGLGIAADRITMTWPNHVHQLGDVELRATFAIPLGGDDLTHVGYLLRVIGGPTLYMTGDTAYHDVMAAAVAPHKPDIFAPVINGAFRNMGPAEAARLARQLDAKIVIPCHWDLFPDNSLPPQLLHTNLKLEGLGDRYRLLAHGAPFTFPEPGRV
jgi:L-ascorbate 6-phosphate lactonase